MNHKNISILDAKTAYENEKNIESNYINCNVETEIKNININAENKSTTLILIFYYLYKY